MLAILYDCLQDGQKLAKHIVKLRVHRTTKNSRETIWTSKVSHVVKTRQLLQTENTVC
jgi:hypothetical protein